MTKQEYDSIDDALKDAETKVVPFAIPDENEITVVGDANATERTSFDVEIQFRLPPEKSGAPYRFFTKKYENVSIAPRKETRVLQAVTAIMPYFKKILPNGDVGSYSDEEKMEIFSSLDDEVFDAIYNVVAAVLSIDAELTEYIVPGSAIRAFNHIARNLPGTVNGADTFFG